MNATRDDSLPQFGLQATQLHRRNNRKRTADEDRELDMHGGVML
jgi:hypothetical protein